MEGGHFKSLDHAAPGVPATRNTQVPLLLPYKLLLEKFHHTTLHGGNTAGQSGGACHPGLVAAHLDLLLSELIFSVLVAHRQDGVRHQDEALEVGLVGDSDRGGVGVDAVSNDATPHLQTRRG